MKRRLLIFIAAAFLTATGLSAAEPWDFPGGGAEEQSARSKYGSLFFQIYPGVESDLGKKSPNVDEAIAKLRLCIKIQPRGAVGAEDRISNKRFSYFPYFMLAKAFEMKGRFDLAKRCVEKELADGAIKSHEKAAEAQTMADNLRSLGALPLMKGWADTILGWESGSGPIVPLSGKPASLSEIRALRAQLEGAQPAAAKGIVDQLKGKISGFCSDEIKARRVLLEELRSDAWKDAMAGAAPAATACAPPSATREPGDAIDDVGRCEEVVVAALRVAGQGECMSLSGLRAAVEAAAGLANASTAAGGIPSACSAVKWKDAAVADVRRGFDSLRKDHVEARRGYEKGLKDLEQALRTKTAGIREAVTQARAKLPADLPPQCVQDLMLGDASREIIRLRGALDPERVQATGGLSKDLLQADRLATEAVNALSTQVRQGVDGLVREKGECPGVATANLEALPALRDAYGSRHQPSDLASLCAKARGASADLQSCWDRNVTLVQQKVRDYIGLAAGAASVRSATTPACFTSSLEALRRRERAPSGAGVSEWAKGARDAVSTTQSCLTETHASVERQWAQVSGRVTASLGPLAGGSGPSGGGAMTPELQQIVRQVEAVATDLKATGDRFKILEPFFAADMDATFDPRAVLQRANMAAGVGDAIWPVLEGARGRKDEAMTAEALKVIRDTVAGPELGRAASALARFEPVAGKLTPFWALNSAFTTFASGDLDGAIRALREAQGTGNLPEAGGGAAMLHATLSYFLAIKISMTRASGGAATGMLEQDARQEASRACGAEPNFAPPAALLGSRTFSEIYQRACS